MFMNLKKSSSKIVSVVLALTMLCTAAISVSAAEVDAQIKGMSAYMGYKEEDIRKMLDRNGGTAELQADILMSKVLEFVAAAK